MAREINPTLPTSQSDSPHINTTDDLAGIFADFINGSNDMSTHGGKMTADDINNFWDNLVNNNDAQNVGSGNSDLNGMDSRSAYFYALMMQQKAKSAAEKEHWANIAAQYQTEAMRDYDNAYNAPSATLQRLMAAGLSRQAAMAVLQGNSSESQAAGVLNEAPTRTQEVANYLQQAAEVGCSMVQTAGVAFPALGQMPHMIRSAKSVADQQQILAENLKYEQDGREAANAFSSAAYEAANMKALTEGKKFDPTTLTSVAEVKELIKWGAEHKFMKCQDYVNNWQSKCEGNLHAQQMIQKGYDGWVSTKDYDPMEDMQPFMKNAMKNEALRTLPQLLNEWDTNYQINAEIDNILANTELIEEKSTTEQLTQKLIEKQTAQAGAQTALIWSTKRGQDIMNTWNEAQYDLWDTEISPAQAAECRATLSYWTQMNQGIVAQDAFGNKVKTTWSGYGAISEQIALRSVRYLNQERYNYLTNPQKWDKEHAGSPDFMNIVHDYSGTLDAIGKSVGIDLTKAEIANTEADTRQTNVETIFTPMQAVSGSYMQVGFGTAAFRGNMRKELQMGSAMKSTKRVHTPIRRTNWGVDDEPAH